MSFDVACHLACHLARRLTRRLTAMCVVRCVVSFALSCALSCALNLTCTAQSYAEERLTLRLSTRSLDDQAEDKKQSAKKKRRKKKRRSRSKLPHVHQLLNRRWMFLMPLSLHTSTGVMDGYRLYQERGGFLEGGLSLTPTLRYHRGRFKLSMPLSVTHREPLAQRIQWTRLRGGLTLSVKRGRFTGSAHAGLRRNERPDWPDLYQPILNDQGLPSRQLTLTDRYSDQRAQFKVSGQRRFDRLKLFANLGFDRLTFTVDPRFDPILRPLHISPDDRDRWYVSLGAQSSKVTSKTAASKRGDARFSWRVKGSASSINYGFEFARDRHTGASHASLGGTPSNPLQRFLRFELAERLSWWLPAHRVRLTLSTRQTHNLDRYQGYRTWSALTLSPQVRFYPAPRWKLTSSAYVLWRRYSADGYQEGPTHLPLDGGDSRRAVRMLRGEVELEHRLRRSPVRLFACGFVQSLSNNFPDYEPGLNPMNGVMVIDFDAQVSELRLGARVAF